MRGVLTYSRKLDSPEQVEIACDEGRINSDGSLERWRAIRDTFTPNPVPVWHDEGALRVAAEWMSKPGIVWTEHVAFAERLSELTGVPYFGAKGFSKAGQYIEDADGNAPIIVSIDANKEGKNLQFKWSRNLYTSMPENAIELQQSLARTHRTGQPKDVVEADIMLGCIEHMRAFEKAIEGSKVIRDTVGDDAKILRATIIDWPSELDVEAWPGALWGKIDPDK